MKPSQRVIVCYACGKLAIALSNVLLNCCYCHLVGRNNPCHHVRDCIQSLKVLGVRENHLVCVLQEVKRQTKAHSHAFWNIIDIQSLNKLKRSLGRQKVLCEGMHAFTRFISCGTKWHKMWCPTEHMLQNIFITVHFFLTYWNID